MTAPDVDREAIRARLAGIAGWTSECDIEGGQPNGIGEIEPSDYREWFTSSRETHHRSVITLTGPWEPGSAKASGPVDGIHAAEDIAALLTALDECEAQRDAALALFPDDYRDDPDEGRFKLYVCPEVVRSAIRRALGGEQ